MPAHFYLGETCNGAIVKRSSTRSDFTHCAVFGAQPAGVIVPLGATTWSTSMDQLRRNPQFRYASGKQGAEVVLVRKVTSGEFARAVKAGDPKNLVQKYRPEAKLGIIKSKTASGYVRKTFVIEDGTERLTPECVDRVSAWRHAASHLGL